MGGSDSSAVWDPILYMGAGAWLGILRGELWTGDGSTGKKPIDMDNPVGLLPLLEHSRVAVLAGLESRGRESGLPPGSMASLIPFGALAHCVAETQSNYWAKAFLDWVSQGWDAPEAIEVCDYLSRSSWTSQEVRHKASHAMHLAVETLYSG